MRRRKFLRTAAAGTLLGAVGVSATETALAASDTIEPLAFDSTASLLDAAGRPLAEESLVAVWAADSAENVDEDGDGDAVDYPASTPIPLVASDGGVVGFGAPIVQDDTDFEAGNEEFALNVLDAEVGGGTVAFDEGHGQFYDANSHQQFSEYAREEGYEVTATTDLTSALGGADAAIVTSPSEAFTDAERSALESFVADGGVLLLFDQSDFGDYDETSNLNAVAEAVGAGFRFNDDQVVDDESNAGVPFVPVTSAFNDAFDYFAERQGLGPPALERGESYVVDVDWVTDGDTVDVRFDNGYVDTVRVLGLDTPETRTANERSEEWEGIDSYDALRDRGYESQDWAIDELAGETVRIRFDENEPLRGDFGRLLAYVEYDPDGSGSLDTSYNRTAVREGMARVYDSGFADHDVYLREEFAAREAGIGVWAESDPGASTEVRNTEVTELYAPYAVSVCSNDGPIDPRRVPVWAGPSATQEGAAVEYPDDVPLVGIDQHARVAMVGAQLVDEAFEVDEGFPVDTSGYGNFAFLTSLLDRLADREGDVLVDGGHGQFNAERSVGAEDAAYYQRYLEGVGLGFEQVNDLTGDLLDRGRALVVSTPVTEFTEPELDAVSAFVDDGGAVVLLGGDADAEARANLDAVSAALCSDLRLNAGRVFDESSNLDGRASLPVTDNFDDWFRLFDGYDPDREYKGARGGPGRPVCHGRSNGVGGGNDAGPSSGNGAGRSNENGRGTGRGE